MKNNILKTTITVGLFAIASSVFALTEAAIPTLISVNPNEAVMCTMDAKMCEDGTTYVGRVGPNCEFAACPSEIDEPEQMICTAEYDPVCAIVDTGVRCITAPCPSAVKQTFSNECMAKNAGAIVVHEASCDGDEEFKLGNEKNDNTLGKGDGTGNGIGNTDKQEGIVGALAEAGNEQERKEILQDAQEKEDVVLEAQEAATLKVVEKRKEILDKKSEEIFSQFDFFIEKIDLVAKKIAIKNETVQSDEAAEILVQAEITLAEANRLKAEAWITFAEIAEAETKEIATEKIKSVGELLGEAKKNISSAFAGVKQSLEFLKK